MDTATPQKGRFAIVSLISGSRLALGGFFVFMALDFEAFSQKLSFFVFVIMFFSDFLDGPLARRWKVVTRTGFILDGLGDRAAYLASLLVMSERLHFPSTATYLIILPDLILYAARSMQP